jgi:formate-dependent nitrite reductase cytochrome c552 subunit
MLGWTTFNLTRKTERLESWIEDYAQRIQDTKQVLDELDNKGTFKADDEIGVVFTAIKEAVDEINEITEQEL